MTRSAPISRAANGMARRAAMRSRAEPKPLSASCRAAIRALSACPCSRPAHCWFRPDIRLAEWLYEAGIGEARAALVENGVIVEARIDRDDGRLKAGDIRPARL